MAAESYSFDGTGNRNLAGGGSSSADGSFNQVQNDGTYTYDYDAEGNQIRRTSIATGAVTEYEFDYRNRLVKVTERASAGVRGLRGVRPVFRVFWLSVVRRWSVLW